MALTGDDPGVADDISGVADHILFVDKDPFLSY